MMITMIALGLVGGSYSEVYQQCVPRRQSFYVLCSATWCEPCQRVKRDLVPQMQDPVAIVDVDQQRLLYRRLRRGCRVIPLLFHYRHTGRCWVRERGVGYDQIQRLIE